MCVKQRDEVECIVYRDRVYCIQRERQTIERETDCSVCIKKIPDERDQMECIVYRERDRP